MPISAVGHAAVLLWTLISFSKSLNDTPQESMPVDIISTKEFRQMMAGAQNAPKADKPKLVVDKVADPKPVEDPTPKVSPKPPIEATQSAPPPPPSNAKPEQKDSKPPVDAIAEALKKEEAKRLEQTKLDEQKQAEEQKKLDEQKQAEEQKKLEEQKQAEEQKKLDEQKQAEEQKKLEEQKRAEEQKKLEAQKQAEEQKKLAEQKKAEEQKKREEARKRAEAKRIEEAKQREEAKKLQDKIANLLDTRDPRREAATGAVPNQTPNLGSTKGTAPTLSQTELDAMRARLMNNWHPDEAVFERPDQYVVVIRFSLGRDRMLSGPPQVVSAGSGPLSQATADAAKRAIMVSQPFDMLSLSHYDEWNDLEITFNPRELRDH